MLRKDPILNVPLLSHTFDGLRRVDPRPSRSKFGSGQHEVSRGRTRRRRVLYSILTPPLCSQNLSIHYRSFISGHSGKGSWDRGRTSGLDDCWGLGSRMTVSLGGTPPLTWSGWVGWVDVYSSLFSFVHPRSPPLPRVDLFILLKAVTTTTDYFGADETSVSPRSRRSSRTP